MAEPLRVLDDPNIVERYDHQYQRVWQTGTGILHSVLDIPREDVIVLQRPIKKTSYDLMRYFQKQGKACVVEIDDDFHSLREGHATREYVNDTEGLHKTHKRWLMKSCEMADLVTVSTPALKERYGRHGRCVILPNFISKSWLETKKYPHKGTWIGWSGSVKVHIGDLDVVGDGVSKALQETKAQFRVIGSSWGVAEALELPKTPPSTGWVSLDKYPKELAQLDIGICPLEDNEFNKSKSALKPLEMAALGVVPIMSPSNEYRRINEEYGIGVIANTPSEWYDHLKHLIEDKDYRQEKSLYGKNVVADNLLIEDNAHLWQKAWETAQINRDIRVSKN